MTLFSPLSYTSFIILKLFLMVTMETVIYTYSQAAPTEMAPCPIIGGDTAFPMLLPSQVPLQPSATSHAHTRLHVQHPHLSRLHGALFTPGPPALGICWVSEQRSQGVLYPHLFFSSVFFSLCRSKLHIYIFSWHQGRSSATNYLYFLTSPSLLKKVSQDTECYASLKGFFSFCNFKYRVLHFSSSCLASKKMDAILTRVPLQARYFPSLASFWDFKNR